MKKIKFTRNTRKFDCGPVAIVNASKWSGQQVSYKKIRKTFDFLYDEYNDGISIVNFNKYLKSKELPFKLVKTIKYINLSSLRRYMKEDKACILLLYTGHIYHTSLAIKMTKNYITLVNWDTKMTIKKLSVLKLKKYLKIAPIGYIIKVNKSYTEKGTNLP